MDKLESFNGQQTAVKTVLDKWEEHRKEIIFISGAAGTGVTWTLEKIAARWEAFGGVSLYARGEAFATQRELFPWLTLALPKTKHLARLEVIKGWVSQGSHSIPSVGPVTGYIVEELLNYRKKQLARQAVVLSAQEQDLLFIIQNTSRDNRLLLAIDNIESWDEASLSLLELILSPNLHDLYPALTNVIVLIGIHGEIPSRLRLYENKLSFNELKIQHIERQNLPLALSVFGFPNVTGESLDLLYDITCGRLDLLHDFGAHLQKEDFAKLSAGENVLYYNIIERRLKEFGEEAAELSNLLCAASIIGQAFPLEDIKCLVGNTTENLNKTLQLASTAHLLNIGGEIACFQSALLHEYFHNNKADEYSKYHEKFAQCLQMMRPSDYEYRLHHLILGERIDEALTCYALAALAANRQSRPLPDSTRIKSAPDWSEVYSYLTAMYKASDKYNNRLLDESLEILDKVESFLPDVLIAERDYLKAQILLKTSRVDEFYRAVEILNRWRILKQTEVEVWSRIVQTLMVALVEINRIEEAHQLEAELTTHYWSRRKVDPWALYSLNVLRRRSECLHYLPTATTRLENALEYFGSQNKQDLPRHPDQYYYTLTNLVGNLVASGRFEDAYARAVELNNLIYNYPRLNWQMLEIASNNFILAAYLSGNLDAEAALVLMEKVIKETPLTGDHILMKNNYSVFLIHAGRAEEAYTLLAKTYAEITASGNPDSYHYYFIGNNLAALHALNGKAEIASKIREEIGTRLSYFYPAINQTLRKRHELIAPAFGNGSEFDVQEFDEYLLKKFPAQVGPQWRFYGRGFLFTDIQFWSHG
jgi:hypothetical protein